MRYVTSADECLLVDRFAQAKEVLGRTGDLQRDRASVCGKQDTLPVRVAVAVVPGAVLVNHAAGRRVGRDVGDRPPPITQTLRPSLRLSRYSSPVIIWLITPVTAGRLPLAELS